MAEDPAPQNNEPPDLRAGDTAPCVGCGLCCDGTIFSKARAEPEEEQRLTDAGLEFFDDGEKHWFRHPCRFSKDGLCTIYDQQRFTVCGAYRCTLLKAYQRGEVSREEALGTVQRALALRAEVAAEEPSAVLWTERQRLRGELERSRERPRLLLKMTALDYWLNRWFHNSRPGSGGS